MLAAMMRELQRISSWTELINQCAACRRGTGGWEKKREGGREEAKVEGTPERKRLEKMYGDLTEHVTWREKREAHTHTHEARTQTHSLAESFSVIPISLYLQLTILIISPAPEIWRIKVSLLQTAVLFCARRWNTSRLKCESVCVCLVVCTPFSTLSSSHHSLPPPPCTSSSSAPSCLIVAWYSKNAKRLEWIKWLALFSFLPSETSLPFMFLNSSFISPPLVLWSSTSLHLHTFSVHFLLSSPPPLFCPATEQNSGVNSSPEFIQNYDSVC